MPSNERIAVGQNARYARTLPLMRGAMRIEASPNFVELLITELVPSGLPSEGDVRIQVKAQIHDFVGSGSCWVEEPNFRSFSVNIDQLFSSFQGSAQLESISPGEFSLSLSPANSRGNILVQVTMSKSLPFPRAMSGTFEIELPALEPLISWSETPRVCA